MSHRFAITVLSALMASVLLVISLGETEAAHWWGGYHWSRASNPFSIPLGDNVSPAWDTYLQGASNDWNPSTVLDTSIVTGGGGTGCVPTPGRIEVCNGAYGNNGWLGLAQVWISAGGHITKGTAKLNDSYFNQPTHNTPAWKRLVMCQEIAHDFGLDHQDVNFGNTNLGSCMDYSADPDGPPSNEHTNAHDFEELVTIYTHCDPGPCSSEGSSSRASSAGSASSGGGSSPASSHIACVVNTLDKRLQIFDLANPRSPVLKGSIITGGRAPFVVTCEGNYAYVGAVTDLFHYQGNMQIYDIANPSAPVLKSTTVTAADPRGIFISGNYAYVTNRYSNSFQIFDISNRNAPVLKSTTSTGTTPADGIAVKGNYAYVTADFSSALSLQGAYAYVRGRALVFDITNPSAPVLKTSLTPIGGSITVFDISSPLAPVRKGNISFAGFPYDFSVQGTHVYAVTGPGKTLHVIDVSNPMSPVLRRTVPTGSASNDSTRAISIAGTYAYVVNWGDSRNVQVFDISTPTSTVSVESTLAGQYPVDIDTEGRSGTSSRGSSGSAGSSGTIPCQYNNPCPATDVCGTLKPIGCGVLRVPVGGQTLQCVSAQCFTPGQISCSNPLGCYQKGEQKACFAAAGFSRIIGVDGDWFPCP